MTAICEHLVYRIAFSRIKGISPVQAGAILEIVHSEEEFFSADERELRLMLGSPHAAFDKATRRRMLDEALHETEFIEANAIDTYYFTDERYPQLLLQCPDAPLMLYSCGCCNLNMLHPVAVVGTRHATHYGIDCTNRFVADLAKTVDHTAVISGLAYGIDAAAHRAALRNGLPTVAVVAHGLNTIYPADHRSLAAEICANGGMIVTDYISTDAIHRSNFLARNRIVAGLCECTLIVESAVKGGAMSTARLARRYNREVMAVPGRISDPYSAGCNELIASLQASILRDATDMAAACNWKTHSDDKAVQKELFHINTPAEQSVIDYILADPDATVADIARHTGLKVGATASLLAGMELSGLIMSLPGGRYQLSRPS